MNRYIVILSIIMALSPGVALADVDIQWRPDYQIVHAGDTFCMGLYAVSTSGADHPVSR